MKAAIAFINNFFIVLRKVLGVLSKSGILNFFYLFIIFKILFLIIYESDFIIYLYLKLFILLSSACGFSKKKLYYNMPTFFCIMRVARHLEQPLSSIIIPR